MNPISQNQSCGIASDVCPRSSIKGSPSNDTPRVEDEASTAGSLSVGEPSAGILSHTFTSPRPAVPSNQSVDGAGNGRNAVPEMESVRENALPWARNEAPPRMSAVSEEDTATPTKTVLSTPLKATESTSSSAQGSLLTRLETSQSGSALQTQKELKCSGPHSMVHSSSSDEAPASQLKLVNSTIKKSVLAQVPENERVRVSSNSFSHQMSTSHVSTSQFLHNSQNVQCFSSNVNEFLPTSPFLSTSPHISALETPERATTSTLRAECIDINNNINCNKDKKAPVAFLPEGFPRKSSLPACNKDENECRREENSCGVSLEGIEHSGRGLQNSQSQPITQKNVRKTPQVPNCSSVSHFCCTEADASRLSAQKITKKAVAVQSSTPVDTKMREPHTMNASARVEDEHRGGRIEPTLEIKRFPSNQKRNRLIPRVVSPMTRLVVAERRGIKPPGRCIGANNENITVLQKDNDDFDAQIAELFSTSEALVFLSEAKKGRNLLTDIDERICDFRQLDEQCKMVTAILVLNRVTTLSRLFTLEGTLKDLGFTDAENRCILAGRIPKTLLDGTTRILSTLFFLGGLPVERFIEDAISSDVFNPVALGIPLILLPLPLPLWLFRGMDPSGLQPKYLEEMNSSLLVNKQVLEKISSLWTTMNINGTHALAVNSEHSNGYFRVEYNPIKKECIPIFPSRKKRVELNTPMSLPKTPNRNISNGITTPKSITTLSKPNKNEIHKQDLPSAQKIPSTISNSSSIIDKKNENNPSKNEINNKNNLSSQTVTQPDILSQRVQTPIVVSSSHIPNKTQCLPLIHSLTEPPKGQKRSKPLLVSRNTMNPSLTIPATAFTHVDQGKSIDNTPKRSDVTSHSLSPTPSEAPTQVVSDSESFSSIEGPLLPTPERAIPRGLSTQQSLSNTEDPTLEGYYSSRYGISTQRSRTCSLSSETSEQRYLSPIESSETHWSCSPHSKRTGNNGAVRNKPIHTETNPSQIQTVKSIIESTKSQSPKTSNGDQRSKSQITESKQETSTTPKISTGITHGGLTGSSTKKSLAKAASLFSRELEREQARAAGKTVLPAPQIACKRMNRNKTIRMVHSPRKEKPIITVKDLQEFHPEQGCVKWKVQDTIRYGAVVAGLTFQILSQIDRVLYSRSLDKNDLESLCNLLNGIPGSVLLHTRLRSSPQEQRIKRMTNIQPRRTRSLYAAEMHPSPNPGNLVIVDDDETNLNIHSQAKTIVENLHLRDTNVFNQYIQKALNPPNQDSSPIRLLNSSEKQAVEGLISRGNISKGVEKLNELLETANPNQYDSNLAYSKLCELHSNQPDLSDLHIEVTPHDFVSIEHNIITNIVQMKEVLDSLNKRSAADAAGWSVALITTIISHQPAITQLLMRFINACLIHQYWPSFLFDCRIIAIPKPNEVGKYRPITITSTWRKIISKAVLKVHSSVLNSTVSSSQYGVSKAYGTESIVSSIQSALDLAHSTHQWLTITQLDLSNAYNLVDRTLLLDTLKQSGLHSSALSYFAYMFRAERLFYYEGQHPTLIPNTRGISQGEPCSPMLFSIYLASLTEEANMRASSGEFGEITNHFLYSCQVPTVMSYLDDIFLLSPNQETAQRTLQWLLQKLVSIGMKPNLAKTHLLVHTNEGIIDTERSIQVKVDSSESPVIISASPSLKVLGSLVTLDDSIRQQFFIEKAMDVLTILFGAIQLHLQNFMLVTRLCISSKLVHLLRTLPVPNSILSDFDEVVKQVIIRVFNLSRTSMMELIFLPQQRGGLGLTALSSIQLISSLALYSEMIKLPHMHNMAFEYFQANPPSLSPQSSSGELFFHKGIDEETTGKCGFLSLCHLFEPLTSLEHLLNIGYDDNNDQNNTFIQHDLWMKQTERLYEDLLKDKKISSPDQYVTLLATSKDSSCSAWLRTVPFANYQKMNDCEFMHSIRYRLGTPDQLRSLVDALPSHLFKNNRKHAHSEEEQNNVPGNNHLLCPLCGCIFGRYHYANCQMNGPIRTARHNLIKHLIANAIAQLPTVSVVVEEYNKDQPLNNTRKVPDITVTINDPTRHPTELEQTLLKSKHSNSHPNSFSIDVVIKDIHSCSNETEHRKGCFAEIGESEKRRSYKSYNEKTPISCLPFGLSSVGELGKTAKAIIRFINEMAARSSVYINTETLIEQISLLIETSRYDMEQNYHEEVQRKANTLAGWQNRNNPSLVPSIEVQGKVPKVTGFWSRQIKKTTNFLQLCNEDTISKQRISEIEHELFAWIPGSERIPSNQESRLNKNMEDNDSDRTRNTIVELALSIAGLRNDIGEVKKPPDKDKDNPQDSPVNGFKISGCLSEGRSPLHRTERKRTHSADKFVMQRGRTATRELRHQNIKKIKHVSLKEEKKSECIQPSVLSNSSTQADHQASSSACRDIISKDFIPLSGLSESPLSLSSTSLSQPNYSSCSPVNPEGNQVLGAGQLINPFSSAPADLPLVNNWAFFYSQPREFIHLDDNNAFTFPSTSPVSLLHAFPI